MDLQPGANRPAVMLNAHCVLPLFGCCHTWQTLQSVSEGRVDTKQLFCGQARHTLTARLDAHGTVTMLHYSYTVCDPIMLARHDRAPQPGLHAERPMCKVGFGMAKQAVTVRPQ